MSNHESGHEPEELQPGELRKLTVGEALTNLRANIDVWLHPDACLEDGTYDADLMTDSGSAESALLAVERKVERIKAREEKKRAEIQFLKDEIDRISGTYDPNEGRRTRGIQKIQAKIDKIDLALIDIGSLRSRYEEKLRKLNDKFLSLRAAEPLNWHPSH